MHAWCSFYKKYKNVPVVDGVRKEGAIDLATIIRHGVGLVDWLISKRESVYAANLG